MKLERTTEKMVRSLLKARGNTMDVWQLSRQCGYLRDVIQGAEFLKKIGAADIKNSTVHLRNKNRLPKYVLRKEKPLSEVMKQYAVYRKQVWFNEGEYDQLELLPQAVGNKLSLMLRQNDLLNRDILCIGDDDLFSIACSLTTLPASITVFDLNKEVIDFIAKTSPRLPVPITTCHINLLKPLPKNYEEAFDVFVAEPPDTVKGMLLFAGQGLRALRENGVLYLGATEATFTKKQWFEIEKTLLQSGVMFTDIIQDFEEYILEGEQELTWKGFEKLPKWVNTPAKEPWFVSTLFRGEVVGEKKQIRFSLEDIEKDLYTSLLP